MTPIENLIEIEENKLKPNDVPPNEAINILFNLITLKNTLGQTNDNYKNIKKFINHYIEVVKVGDYGYDNFNYKKIDQLLNLLSHKEQVTVLLYAISATARELPEHKKDWFVERKHKAEIGQIVSGNTIKLFPKAFLLFTGLNIWRLFLSLCTFFLITNIILLPSPSNFYSIFNIKYDTYSANFILNHVLNILSLFADLDNDFKIEPINGLGLIVLIMGKVSFVLLMVNFIYRKISDKISLK